MTFDAQEMLACNDSLKRYAHRLHREAYDAEDLLQETYTKAWAKRHLYKRDTNLRGWLITIMHHHFCQSISRFAAKNIIYWESIYETVDDREGSDTIALINDIIKSFASLSAEHKAILKASIDGKDYFEMAKEFGIERGTVASRINRARQKMKESIEGRTIY